MSLQSFDRMKKRKRSEDVDDSFHPPVEKKQAFTFPDTQVQMREWIFRTCIGLRQTCPILRSQALEWCRRNKWMDECLWFVGCSVRHYRDHYCIRPCKPSWMEMKEVFILQNSSTAHRHIVFDWFKMVLDRWPGVLWEWCWSDWAETNADEMNALALLLVRSIRTNGWKKEWFLPCFVRSLQTNSLRLQQWWKQYHFPALPTSLIREVVVTACRDRIGLFFIPIAEQWFDVLRVFANRIQSSGLIMLDMTESPDWEAHHDASKVRWIQVMVELGQWDAFFRSALHRRLSSRSFPSTVIQDWIEDHWADCHPGLREDWFLPCQREKLEQQWLELMSPFPLDWNRWIATMFFDRSYKVNVHSP